jgi:hypothetical protein
MLLGYVGGEGEGSGVNAMLEADKILLLMT